MRGKLSIVSLVVLVMILLLGTAVRLYQLGRVPHGLTWDEAAIGYNGYSVIKTRRDEWLTRLPSSFKSFGDYKAPLAIYLNGPFTVLFGLSAVAVRLPFALSGIVLIGLLFWLQYLANSGKDDAASYALAAAFVVATSSWAVHFSRIGFESGIAVTLLTLSVCMFFATLATAPKVPVQKRYYWSTGLLLISATCAALSLYAYHSAKVTVPLLGLGLMLLYGNKLLRLTSMWGAILIVLLTFALLWPLASDTIWGNGLSRAESTLVTYNGSILAYLQIMVTHFFTHLSSSFLLLGQADSLRHSSGVFGVLYPTTWILWLIGSAAAAAHLVAPKMAYFVMHGRRFSATLLIWLVAGILPAVIAQEVPHPNRSLLALPAFCLLAIFGLQVVVQVIRKWQPGRSLIGSHGESELLLKSILGTLFALHCLFFVAYVNDYFTRYAKVSGETFSEGYLEAFAYAKNYEKGAEGKPKADIIVFTSEYGQPYIYALFARKTSPYFYQNGSLATYFFTDDVGPGDLERTNALLVTGQKQPLPLTEAEHVIFGADGQVRFAFYRSKNWTNN